MTKKLGSEISKLRESEFKLAGTSKKSQVEQEKLTRKRDEAAVRVAVLVKKTKDLRIANREETKSIVQKYGSIDKLTSSQNQLLREKEKLLELERRQVSTDSQVRSRTEKMLGAELRIRMAQRIGGLMKTPFDTAMQAQKMSFEVSTVVNVPEKYKKDAMRKAEETGAAMAKAGYSTYAESMDI